MTPKIIYLYCPGNVITGGIHSLHNLGSKLVENGFNAGMLYYDKKPEILRHAHIRAYGIPSFNDVLDVSENLLIVSETETAYLNQFRNIRKMVYWLGLNNYFKKPPFRFPFTCKTFRKLIQCRNYWGYSSGMLENLKRAMSWWAKSSDPIWQNPVLHMSNSFYAAGCLNKKGIGTVFVLHNPVRDACYQVPEPLPPKRQKLVFGPKTPRLLIMLCRLLTRFETVRLKHLAPDVLHRHLLEAKVFAEFGNHSGRDRMPREAALLGCIVFTNLRGSASEYRDMPFPERYKIPDSLFTYFRIIRQLKDAVRNYAGRQTDFSGYLTYLNQERMQFPEQVKAIFSQF